LRVVAAMSGGVDSAVAAARAAEQGHDVTGIHLALSRNPKSYRTGARGCCTIEDANDARRAADVIGIPFYVRDLSERFHEDVVEDFMNEYAAGHTPNPCLRCNEKIKFAAVLDKALALGFDAVCTGHYARIEGGRLCRAVDGDKDQSYVLGVLRPDQIAAAMFPLGESQKTDVRAEAAARGLAVATKPDSHDICFIPSGDTAGWLRQRLGAAPGDIVDETGEVVGAHEGAYAFTVGQRRGLALSTAAPDRRPRYVLSISPAARTVTVGPAERLAVSRIVCGPPTWCGATPPLPRTSMFAQVRAHGAAIECRVSVIDGRLVADVEPGLEAVAAGQTLVVYDGDEVLGSATIDQATSTPPNCSAPLHNSAGAPG
ncbi:MAG: tRNA-uridine 2-sulfurtransferase, partial [Frankiaceae bacterium]|nr:tRNA-uridine 2-sulfurtransferase [Frankiaceae bacterium]